MPPGQLMDPAFLRRIPYKIEVAGPSPAEFQEIFRIVARPHGLEVPDEAVDFVVSELTGRLGLALASYQPGFLVGQILAACKYRGIPPAFHRDMLGSAIGNLHPKDGPGYGMVARRN